MSGDKLVNSAAERNKQPILDVIRDHMPQCGIVLEIASGTGQHCAFFSPALSEDLTWQPTDARPDNFGSIAAYTSNLRNVLPPVVLDATWPPDQWPVHEGPVSAVLVINMTHISPWAATAGLLAGAAHWLEEGGMLFMYGPFKVTCC